MDKALLASRPATFGRKSFGGGFRYSRPASPVRHSNCLFSSSHGGPAAAHASTVARRSNWKAMTGAATSADDEVDYFKALASLIRVKQPR